MRMPFPMRFFLLVVLAHFALPSFAADKAEASVWAALRAGGQVVLMRHGATESGIGDPPGYVLDDCRSQRNLSNAGRDASRRLGERFVAEKVKLGRVFSSPWCRCRDTATLAFGRTETLEALGSFFDSPQLSADYTARLKKRIATEVADLAPGDNLVLVTHQVNISALVNEWTAMGEILVIEPKSLKVVGRLQSPAR